MNADTAVGRLRDAIEGERADWHRVEVDPADLRAVLDTIEAVAEYRKALAARVAALLDELAESPLPGARYAYMVVGQRLDDFIEQDTPPAAPAVSLGVTEPRPGLDLTGYGSPAAPLDVERLGKPWLVRLTCCGRADGVYAALTWEEADRFRLSYTAPGHYDDVSGLGGGHRRSAVIEDGYAARLREGSGP